MPSALPKTVTPPLRLWAALLALAPTMLGCVHGPCDAWTSLWGCRSKWALPPDPSVRCPNFYETVPATIDADGGLFETDDLPVQALQVATEDFFGGSRPPGRPCSEGRGAYRYRLIRQGEVVFVKIVATPRQCGVEILTHEGATYAIGPDGKILHRHLGASLFDDYDGDPDGGHPASPEQIDVFEGDPAVVPPVEFFTRDAGADPDGGPGPGAVVEPGAETRPDAGTPR